MASGDEDSEDLNGGSHEPRECMACRGTGSVISNLGGAPTNVECPWCAGAGVRRSDIDAQARWGEPAAPAAEPVAGEPAGAQAEQPAG